MSSEQSIGTTPTSVIGEALVGEIAKVKITRLFSTGQYEHVKFEIDIPLPQGRMGQALVELDQALVALNPASQPHDALTQLQYLASRREGNINQWGETQISLYEQWDHSVKYAKQVLDSYTQSEPLEEIHGIAQRSLLTIKGGQYFYGDKRISNFTLKKEVTEDICRYEFRTPTKIPFYVYGKLPSCVIDSSVSFRSYVCGLGNFHWAGNQDAFDQLMFSLLDDQSNLYHAPDRADIVRALLTYAVSGVLEICGNSYVNACTEQWLRHAASLGAYPHDGPFTGKVDEVAARFEEWLETVGGLPVWPDVLQASQCAKTTAAQPSTPEWVEMFNTYESYCCKTDPYADALALIRRELSRALEKFPTWPTDPTHAMNVITEEAGELAQKVDELCYEPGKTTVEKAQHEAAQLGAMAMRFLASIDRYEWKPSAQHHQSNDPFAEINFHGSPESNSAQPSGRFTDQKFLMWIHDRLEQVHHENPNAIINALPIEQSTPNYECPRNQDGKHLPHLEACAKAIQDIALINANWFLKRASQMPIHACDPGECRIAFAMLAAHYLLGGVIVEDSIEAISAGINHCGSNPAEFFCECEKISQVHGDNAALHGKLVNLFGVRYLSCGSLFTSPNLIQQAHRILDQLNQRVGELPKPKTKG